MNITYNAVLLRYHEIAIKGRNRKMFENKLADSVRRLLHQVNGICVAIQRGRIVVHRKQWAEFTEHEAEIIRQQLKKCFGLESFSLCVCIEPEMEQIEKTVTETFEQLFQDKYAATTTPDNKLNYRMRARRGDKRFPLKSKEIEIHFANILLPKYDGLLKVNLMDPEVTIGVEVRDKHCFVYYDGERGPGGLPVGSSGSMLCLLSGGIDSPAASFVAMKRGSNVSFLTFHSYPYTAMDSVEKVGRLVEVINGYQKKQPYFASNLAPAQKEIRDKCKERFRTILYRRMMMRIASVLADFRGDKALLTGESLGQVASQTLENMTVINSSTQKLIVRPLVGFDKNETIALARKYGTFDISNEECADSCTVFAPASPATASKLQYIEYDEENLDLPKLVRECIKQTKFIDPVSGEASDIHGLNEFIDGMTDEEIAARF